MSKDDRVLTQEEVDALFMDNEEINTKMFGKPPTPGYHKLKGAARDAARSRAEAFYPFKHWSDSS